MKDVGKLFNVALAATALTWPSCFSPYPAVSGWLVSADIDCYGEMINKAAEV
jgi:hypothetical protein